MVDERIGGVQLEVQVDVWVCKFGQASRQFRRVMCLLQLVRLSCTIGRSGSLPETTGGGAFGGSLKLREVF